MSRTKLKLVGMTYGRGTVISSAGMKGKRTLWNLQCTCGNVYQARSDTLQGGYTQSCGCYKTETLRYRNAPLGSRDETTAGLMLLYTDYKSQAIKRGRLFELTVDQVRDITSSHCTYCGIKPMQIKTGRGSYGQYTYNGIDRIDNNSGYTIGNVTACCKVCNRAKREMTHAEFEAWLDQIVRFRSTC